MPKRPRTREGADYGSSSSSSRADRVVPRLTSPTDGGASVAAGAMSPERLPPSFLRQSRPLSIPSPRSPSRKYVSSHAPSALSSQSQSQASTTQFRGASTFGPNDYCFDEDDVGECSTAPAAAAGQQQNSHEATGAGDASTSRDSLSDRATLFVHGLQTFVGGLQMSQPTMSSNFGTSTQQQQQHQDTQSPDRDRGQMHEQGNYSSASTTAPLQQNEERGEEQITMPARSLLTHNEPARMSPGVSPGWHVGPVGMHIWSTERLTDEEGYVPLASFPGGRRPRHLEERLARTERGDGSSSGSSSRTASVNRDSNNEVKSSNNVANRNGICHEKACNGDSNSLCDRSSKEANVNGVVGMNWNSPTVANTNPSSKSKEKQTASQLSSLHLLPMSQGGVTLPPIKSASAAGAAPGLIKSSMMEESASSKPSFPTPALHNFEVLDTLGTGTFGRVLLVRDRTMSRQKREAYFALKVLRKSEIVKLKQVQHIESERAILNDIEHPFVVNMHCTFQDSLNCYMLMEYVVGGEIFSHLRRAGRFSVDVTRFYIAALLLALRHLHSHGIVYRDLKPENLLLDETGYIKMTDFGFAKKLFDERTWTLCGTPEYLAPEVIQNKGHGRAADYWALGVLMFEMICGHPPFFGSDSFATYEAILAGNLRYPAHVDASSKQLMSSLLEPDVSKRLGNLRDGAHDVMNHPWFFGVDWAALEAKKITAPIVPGNLPPGDTSMFQKYSNVDLNTMPGLSLSEADPRAATSAAHRSVGPQVGKYDHLFLDF